jgi:hypothetical protein
MSTFTELSQQTTAKLVLLGEMGSGKSSLVLRYVKGQFFDYQVIQEPRVSYQQKCIPSLHWQGSCYPCTHAEEAPCCSAVCRHPQSEQLS